MEINDANWRVSKVRVINEHPSLGFEITVKEAGVVVFNQTVPAGQTQTWNTSGIQLGWQPDFFDTERQEWRADGIDMGDYEISAGTVR